MNVLLYSEFFYPVPGGTQSFVLQLARGLAQESPANSVTLVTQTPAESRARSSSQDSTPGESQPFQTVRRPGLLGLFSLLRRADLVHIAGPALSPMALSLLARKRFVVEHHGCQVACPNGLLFFEPDGAPCPGHYMAGRYAKCLACNSSSVGSLKSLRLLLLTPLRRWLSNRAAANIMPTDWLARVLKLNRTTIIHHGVAPSSLARPTPSVNSGASVTFAFQGRLVTTKGIATLLDSAAILRKEGRSFRVKIFGDGPERAAMEARAATLGGAVEFHGHVPDDRLDDALADASAVIMPSLGGEVFGLVAAENMLRGKLVIVSDLGALAEVVGDAGLVFPAGDAAALAACMRRVLENPALARSLGDAARARAQQLFTVRRMMDEHLAVYGNVLS